MFVSGGRYSYQRWLTIGLGATLGAALLAATAPQAMARGYEYGYRHHHLHRAVSAVDNPPYSAIVVDENSGHEIYGVNENELRHPASITKVMTLYLLFEQLEKGAMTLDTQIPISEHAASQEPSKLGIAAGDSLSVEDAIKAVVTRSANDVAVAIAEAIGGDESSFAEMMTRKAHALGMSRTLYRNASGLPNDEQWTTAHDLTVLARSLEERFPNYFKYFSTHEFNYDGEVIGNHNHLLGHIDGVDGIKTGYTRASGFNLLTSVHRDGRSLVAVVMGGRTAGARDRAMEGADRDPYRRGVQPRAHGDARSRTTNRLSPPRHRFATAQSLRRMLSPSTSASSKPPMIPVRVTSPTTTRMRLPLPRPCPPRPPRSPLSLPAPSQTRNRSREPSLSRRTATLR